MSGAHDPSGASVVRPATEDDAPALTQLWRAVDTHWFGAAEHDESEVLEELARLDDLEHDTRLTFEGDRLAGAVLRGRHESFVLVRPGAPSGPVHLDALSWLLRRPPARIEVLERDTHLLALLAEHRWRHAHSTFELSRPVSDDWPTADPTWPDGVDLCDARTDELTDVHRLVYVEAGFADIQGHVLRTFDDWRAEFVGDRALTDSVLLARRDERLVGVAIVRTFSDGMGWISQLAVAPAERGLGLGRALVSESFRRLVGGGASAVGLGVSAANRGALRLYLGLGLDIDREWMVWDGPTPSLRADATPLPRHAST